MAKHGSKWWVLVLVDAALFMILVDRTIVNIAIPHLMRDLHGGLADVEWVMNGYILAFVVSLLIFGRMGDLWGRRRLFLVGVAVFSLASVASGAAVSMEMLIGARVVQGLGGAAMMPQTLSILTVSFPADQRGFVMGLWGAVAGLATAVGPSLGGLIVTTTSWRWIFFVNPFIGLVTFLGILYVLEESRSESAERRLDLLGTALGVATTFPLTFALIEGHQRGWTSPLILSLFGLSLVAGIAFVVVEGRRDHALMPPSLFRNRTFAAGNLAGLFVLFGLVGVTFLLPIFLQGQLGYSAIETGLYLTPMSALVVVVGPIAGRLSDRIGAKWIVVAGMACLATGIFLLRWLGTQVDFLHFILPLMVAGVGIGLSMAPTTSVVMSSVPRDRVGNASGILGTFRQFGSVLGLSVMSAILADLLASNLRSALAGDTAIPAGVKQKLLAEAAGGARQMMMAGGGGASGDPGPAAHLVAEQFLASLHTTFEVAAAVALVGVVVALFIEPGVVRGDDG